MECTTRILIPQKPSGQIVVVFEQNFIQEFVCLAIDGLMPERVDEKVFWRRHRGRSRDAIRPESVTRFFAAEKVTPGAGRVVKFNLWKCAELLRIVIHWKSLNVAIGIAVIQYYKINFYTSFFVFFCFCLFIDVAASFTHIPSSMWSYSSLKSQKHFNCKAIT